MIGVGEQAGALETMLTKIADFYEEEVDAAVGDLMTAMEPMMIVVLGVIVGGIVISMYLPIFTLVGQAQQQVANGSRRPPLSRTLHLDMDRRKWLLRLIPIRAVIFTIFVRGRTARVDMAFVLAAVYALSALLVRSS